MVLIAVEWFSVVVYSGLGVETRGLFGMATEQMAQMFEQLQQLSQQLVNQLQMFRQSGNAETAVSSSDGNSHQCWRCASGQDDVRCPVLADKSVFQDERFQG